MELANYLQEKKILLYSQSQSKEALLKEMVQEICADGGVGDLQAIIAKVLEREKLRSTGFGRGLAVAHARIEGCQNLNMVVARPVKPIEWGAQDKQPVTFVVLVIGSDREEALYLQLLSDITKIWARKETQALLLSAKEPFELIQIISQAKLRMHPRE